MNFTFDSCVIKLHPREAMYFFSKLGCGIGPSVMFMLGFSVNVVELTDSSDGLGLLVVKFPVVV